MDPDNDAEEIKESDEPRHDIQQSACHPRQVLEDFSHCLDGRGEMGDTKLSRFS